jgi:Rv2632c-like
MAATRHWTVDIVIDEHEDERTTHAEARLKADDREQVSGRGTAYRHPDDVDVPQIGDELAAARALSELAHRLVLAAAEDIEQVTHQPTHLRG